MISTRVGILTGTPAEKGLVDTKPHLSDVHQRVQAIKILHTQIETPVITSVEDPCALEMPERQPGTKAHVLNKGSKLVLIKKKKNKWGFMCTNHLSSLVRHEFEVHSHFETHPEDCGIAPRCLAFNTVRMAHSGTPPACDSEAGMR